MDESGLGQHEQIWMVVRRSVCGRVAFADERASGNLPGASENRSARSGTFHSHALPCCCINREQKSTVRCSMQTQRVHRLGSLSASLVQTQVLCLIANRLNFLPSMRFEAGMVFYAGNVVDFVTVKASSFNSFQHPRFSAVG